MKNKLDILLIEDDRGDALLFRELLGTLSVVEVAVTEAGDLKEGISNLKNRDFDAVITDLGLPDSSGLKTFKSLCPYTERTPVVVLTGNEDEKTGNGAIALGAQDYLVKGFLEPSMLLRTIRYAIERKHSEVKLRERDDLFRISFENGAIGRSMIRMDGSFITVNGAFVQIFGYEIEELEGMDISDITLPEDLHICKGAMGKLVGGDHVSVGFESRKKHKDGSEILVKINLVLARPSKEEDPYFLADIEDITERKKAEKVIEETANRYQTLFSQSYDFILIMDGETIIECNERTLETFGLRTKKEIIGRTPFDVSPDVQPDGQITREKGNSIIGRVLRGKPQLFDWTHQKIDGKLLDTQISLTSVWVDGKQYLQAIGRDVTESKRAEMELKEKEERFHSMVECIQDGVIIMEDHRVVYVNKRTTEILGYSAGEMKKVSPVQLVVDEDMERLQSHLAAYRTQGDLPAEVSFWIRRKDGEKRCINNRFSSAVDNGSKNLQFIVITDITEQKYAEQALIESEMKYRMVFDNSPVGIGLTRLNGEIIAFNDKIKEIFGSAAMNMDGMNIRDFYSDPGDRELIVDHARKHQSIKNHELNFKKLNGERMVVRLTTSPFKLGEELVIQTIIEDITEIKDAEARLIKLSNAIEQSPSVVAITDLSGRIEYVNPTFTELTGYHPEEVYGEKASILKSGMMPDDLYRICGVH